MNIKLTEQQKVKLLNSTDVYEVMQRILLRENKIDRDKEHFWIIGLANDNKILYIELVSMGSYQSTIVEPINVFRVVVQKNAVKAILVHNYPSGELRPTREDKDITDRLIQVGRIIKVEVIEHLIITPKSFLSFVDTGVMAELDKSVKFMPPYKIVEMIRREEKKIRKEAEERAEERGTQLKAIEMAKAMKTDGESIDKIVKYTRISIEEIKKL